jgi:pimeloyl-ACP methyl ester carboxylesterase
MKQIAYELHTALRKTGNPGPYVLVGQSIGGLLIRTFADLYPKEVAGMVLVDSTHEDTTLNINGKDRRMRELSQGRTIPPIQKTIPPSDKTIDSAQRQKLEEFLKQMGPPKINPPFDRLPLPIQEWRLWAKAQTQHYVADDDPYWGEEFAEFYAARKAKEYPLGDTPLIVLTRGKREYPDTDAGTTLNNERKRMQRDLLGLSRNSKQIIATTSGHHIQLDDPKLVIDAIHQVVDAVQRRAKM